jgi:hypothetical protein
MTRLLVSIGFFLAASACGLPGAREQAAVRSCDFYERCGNIGSGKTYATRDECMTKQRANWVDTWPTDRCDGKLNGANLEVCLSAISATQCDNFIDLLATASKCGRDKVCAP